MTLNTELKKEVHNFIGNGQPEDAIELLISNYNTNSPVFQDLLLLKFQLNKLEKDKRLNIIDNNFYSIEYSRIINSILNLLNDKEFVVAKRKFPIVTQIIFLTTALLISIVVIFYFSKNYILKQPNVILNQSTLNNNNNNVNFFNTENIDGSAKITKNTDGKAGELFKGGVFLYEEKIEGSYWNEWWGHPLKSKDDVINLGQAEITIRGEGKTVDFVGMLSINCSNGKYFWAGTQNFIDPITEIEAEEIVPKQVITNAIRLFCPNY